jgi:hypothetical protein
LTRQVEAGSKGGARRSVLDKKSVRAPSGGSHRDKGRVYEEGNLSVGNGAPLKVLMATEEEEQEPQTGLDMVPGRSGFHFGRWCLGRQRRKQCGEPVVDRLLLLFRHRNAPLPFTNRDVTSGGVDPASEGCVWEGCTGSDTEDPAVDQLLLLLCRRGAPSPFTNDGYTNQTVIRGVCIKNEANVNTYNHD